MILTPTPVTASKTRSWEVRKLDLGFAKTRLEISLGKPQIEIFLVLIT